MSKKILITGGFGFIGSHLSNALHELGYHITLWDVKNSSVIDINYTKETIVDLTAEIIDESFDLIYHLASPIGVKNIIDNSQSTLIDSLKINMHIDELAKIYDIPVVYASSSEVFGSQVISSNSNYNIKQVTDSPRWSYAASKVAGEALFHNASYPTSIIRFFNVVGPGQITEGMVVPTFINNAQNNAPLIITDNGLRNYCDIRDAIIQIVNIGLDLLNNKDLSRFNQKSFNIGSQNSDNLISPKVLAKHITKIYDSESDISGTNESTFDRVIEFDDDLLLDMNIPSYGIEEIILNIKNNSDYELVHESEEAYNQSLDHILGDM